MVSYTMFGPLYLVWTFIFSYYAYFDSPGHGFSAYIFAKLDDRRLREHTQNFCRKKNVQILDLLGFAAGKKEYVVQTSSHTFRILPAHIVNVPISFGKPYTRACP